MYSSSIIHICIYPFIYPTIHPLLTYVSIIALPTFQSFELSIDVTTTSVIISATYTDNNPQPVLQFYVTVNSVTYTIKSFPLEIDINQFTAGQSYTVTVIAENAIGNSTLTSRTFTIPRELM